METQETPTREQSPPHTRARGRTTLLIAAAAALGVIGGVCTGYVMQAGRTPTPLPALSQPEVTQAKGSAPEPLSAAQDRKVRTDRDLRKLLLKRPAGAKDWILPSGDDGWLSVMAYANFYERPDFAFENLVDSSVRRIAVTSWTERGTLDVEIRLIQFRESSEVASARWLDEQLAYAREDLPPGKAVTPVRGALDGGLVVQKPERRAGGPPLYEARSLLRRGDIHVEMWFVSTEPISEKRALSLSEKQLERL